MSALSKKTTLQTPKSGEDKDKLSQQEKENIKKIIKEQNAKILKEFANKLGKKYSRDISTSQIRNVLDRIQRMKKYNPNELLLLEPLLAYVVGKQQKHKRPIFDHFYQVVSEAINQVEKEEHFEYFRRFIEAIVAYHRYHGGKE